MAFQKGKSGNPAGRKPGIPDRRTRIAQAFANEFDAIVAALVKKAKDGDMQAAALYLSRVEPPLRPKAERVQFPLDITKPLAEQAQQVLSAVAAGDLDPDTGKLLIDCIHSQAGLHEVDGLIAKLVEALERANRAAPVARGGVVYADQ